MTLKYFKIGEVAELLKTTIRTIRYYEEENLLEPHRTNGGTRLYLEQDIYRLKAILHLADNGFSLEVIRLIGNTRKTCQTGDAGSKQIPSIINNAINDIDEKLLKLNTLKTELAAAQRKIKRCSGCTNKPSSQGCPDCSVNKNLKKIEVLNLVWG